METVSNGVASNSSINLEQLCSCIDCNMSVASLFIFKCTKHFSGLRHNCQESRQDKASRLLTEFCRSCECDQAEQLLGQLQAVEAMQMMVDAAKTGAVFQ